ncbi:hypothetical protein SNEBB_004234 [Seison nebaliae]|nr:hypothetical protein SNEBB_004234 [Seison nebaliae]
MSISQRTLVYYNNENNKNDKEHDDYCPNEIIIGHHDMDDGRDDFQEEDIILKKSSINSENDHLNGIDKIFSILNAEFNGYQKRIYFFVSPILLFVAYQTFSSTFLMAEPYRSCSIPEFNGTDDANCTNWTISTKYYRDNLFLKWNFFQDSQRLHWRSYSDTALFLGGIFGSIITGTMSDHFGRRLALQLNLLGLILFNILMFSAPYCAGLSISRQYLFYMISRTFSSIFLEGLWMTPMTYCVEIVGGTKRNFIEVLMAYTFIFGELFLALTSYLTYSQWEFILSIAFIPIFLLFFLSFFIPESPRWLLMKKDEKEVLKVFQLFDNRKNSKNINIADLLHCENCKIESSTLIGKKGSTFSIETTRSYFIIDRRTIRNIFTNINRYRTIIFRIAVIMITWTVVALVYYGISLHTDKLSKINPYFNFAITASVEIPSTIFCHYTLDRFGRKVIFYMSLVFTSLFCILTAILMYEDGRSINGDYSIAIFVMILFEKFFISITYIVIYIHASELFPTKIRGQILGYGGSFALIGSALSPQIVDKVPQLWKVNIIYGISTIVAALMIGLLPETLNKEMPQTFDDSMKL